VPFVPADMTGRRRPPCGARRLASGLLVLLLVGAACSKREGPEAPAGGAAPRTASVTTITVTPTDVPVVFEHVAQTQSSHVVNIYARVTGFLDKRTYTEGAVVKEGQTLFLMDPKPFQVQLDQAQAALAMQEASLQTARSNLARVKPLTALNALSQKDLDDANGQFQTAAAAVEQAKAQVASAKLNLSYTTITSPVTGITSAALQTDGTYINQQNSQLATVMVLTPMWVNFSVSENELKKYRDDIDRGRLRAPRDEDYVVEIVLVDGSLFPHTGRITFLAPSFNAQTGTFLLRASVDNPQGVLRPNQYVRARAKGAVRPKAMLVPQRAVQQGAKGHSLWVVGAEGKAESRPVVVGDWHGTDVIIVEGLRAGDQVIVDGALTLRPGEPVTATPLTPPPAKTGKP
jgi:membrane fusion protein (multidrug efflux system)